jgi:hypothetical protein
MRRKIFSIVTVVLLAVGAGLVGEQAASAAFNPATCNTGADYATAFFGSTPGNVIVPSGATCNLQEATVGGNVVVQPGGRLIIGSGTVVKGSVTANNAGTDTASPLGSPQAFSVIICNSTIGGNVSISGSASEVTVGGNSSGGGCGGNSIGGGVSVSNNHGRVEVSDNSPGPDCHVSAGCKVGGGVSVFNNTGPVEVNNNKITGGLSCSGNGTISSSGNTTGGAKSGQCAAVTY